MNVLILTPDAVGSTLLQRLLTIYMQFHDFDRPVINLHELTNGLHRYYSPEFNREVLGRELHKYSYHQSLEEITSLLRDADHYKTSRMAHYHIRRRGDDISSQVPFYRYLNENFFVISCRRQNLFEHALSMTMNKITKKLNVYTPGEKINTFIDVYQHGVELDLESFVDTLDAYKLYVAWCKQYFDIGAYFNYEKDLPQLEKYILNLPVFSAHPKKITWKQTFGLDFSDWNRCHFYTSDVGSVALDQPEALRQLTNNMASHTLDQDISKQYFESAVLENYRCVSDASWPEISSLEEFDALPEHIRAECENFHYLPAVQHYRQVRNIVSRSSAERKEFLSQHAKTFAQANGCIEQMQRLGILPSGVPIKKQTLREKMHVIRNIKQCIDSYNRWIQHHPDLGAPVDAENLQHDVERETAVWKPPQSTTLLQ